MLLDFVISYYMDYMACWSLGNTELLCDDIALYSKIRHDISYI